MALHTTRHLLIALLLGAALSAPAQARVTRIVIDETIPFKPPWMSSRAPIPYEKIAGRAFGELDPTLPVNAIIQDIDLARDKDGKVRYVASFVLYKPVNPRQTSGLMWHDAPNRGGVLPMAVQETEAGDVMLASAWQGDNAGGTTVRRTASVEGGQFLQVPVARNPDGSPVTGKVLGRIVNRTGKNSQALVVQSSPIPYKPVSLDTRQSTLVSRGGEAMDGKAIDEVAIAPGDWAWARCNESLPFPGSPDPTQICLKDGFDRKRLYQVVYTAANPYVLGIGFAAWRDVGHFFKTARADDQGNPNPIAQRVAHSIGRGVSQSGNFLRAWLHLGFNQAEGAGKVHDGIWPIISNRRLALNVRWAQPDGVQELYQAGSEGPQWWLPHADPVRRLPAGGTLDRCIASKTCPKIIEHFGSTEVWAMKMTPGWVGTDGKADLPLPEFVRRYYIASSPHGGGAGGFNSSLPGVELPAKGPFCGGNNFGNGVLPANPVPHYETFNAIRLHLRNWVTKGIDPPPSRYPTLAARAGEKTGTLAPAHKAGIGFPTLPGLRATVPERDFIISVLDYDWGPKFNAMDLSGIQTNVPPPVRRSIPMFAPKVDADGNELGGVPVVLLDAPLGTYLGWNITADGEKPFHKGQICNYVGGMIPFATTARERSANGDPRLSLEERYGSHDGYVRAVQRAADRAVRERFLLPQDAARLVKAAQESKVLR